MKPESGKEMASVITIERICATSGCKAPKVSAVVIQYKNVPGFAVGLGVDSAQGGPKDKGKAIGLAKSIATTRHNRLLGLEDASQAHSRASYNTYTS